ncbi:cAMP-regulated phosphoprotein 21-like [Littorina saxatilis]|uniref:Uncharacterized protein n=1 Tax=Littorina saxatilis TaxID=31220 RepID=A0AAN9G2K7_9CAEN
MAEAERRPGKTPLLKQKTEIEDMEEETSSQSEESNHHNNTNDVHNTDDVLTTSTSVDEEKDVKASERGAYSPPTEANGEAAESPDTVTSGVPPSTQPEVASSPQSTTNQQRSLKMNHSLSSKSKPLMRGTAVCEYDSVPTTVLPEVKVTTTPSPDSDDSPCEHNVQPPLLGAQERRSTLQKNGSLSSDAGTSNCSLSRESSIEKSLYKDSSGCDLEEFIKKTLIKSKKDKQMLLSLERDFKIFVESPDQHYQLAEMCSYDRMICHRVAAFYGMEHNIDKSGKCVIVSKTKFTRIPTFCCEEYVKTAEPAEDSGSEKKQLKLLKKPVSLDERSRADKAQFSGNRTKSLEERQKTYEERRKMIFGASSEESPNYTVIEPSPGQSKRLNSLHSREWSSTDSSGYMSEEGARLRRSVMAKSNSYGDSITSDSAPVRTKLASPENSQSPLSRSSSADVNSPNHGFGTGPPYTVLVAPDINAIPPGSMVVNPITLQPHTNADGTTYRYNPHDLSSVPPWLVSGQPANIQHHPSAPNISFNPAPSVHQVQYTQNNDLCNRFSAMEVATPLETSLEGQQMIMTHHQPQPAHQPHLQQPGQFPIMVSTGIQPPQQYISTYSSPAQGPSFYTGAQLQFVPVDAQGQCLSLTATSPQQMQSGMVSYGQPQLVQTASNMQPGMMDQSGMTPGNPYGQTVYTGTVNDGGNANGCYVPYMTNSSVMYPTTQYGGGGMTMTPAAAAAHYGAYNPPQSSSPQLTQFAPMTGAQVRPATPPCLPIAQPVGYHHNQQGMGVSSPPQFQQGTYYQAPPHHYPGQGQAMGQVMQVSVRPQGGAGGGAPVSTGHTHHHQHHPQGSHPPSLQHSQSFPMLRSVPTSMCSAPNPAPMGLGSAHLGLGSTPNGNPNPPHHSQHPMMTMKSMSIGSMQTNGGAATPDKDTPGLMGGASAFMPGVNQATPMQFPGQFVAQGIRQPQPGDLRMMGGASIRPQMTPSLIAFQPVRNSKPSGPRQSRPPKRHHSNLGSNQPPPTTASASVARVMSHDSASAVQQTLNRQ